MMKVRLRLPLVAALGILTACPGEKKQEARGGETQIPADSTHAAADTTRPGAAVPGATAGSPAGGSGAAGAFAKGGPNAASYAAGAAPGTGAAGAVPLDTGRTDLSKIRTNLPKAAPDTFHPLHVASASLGGGRRRNTVAAPAYSEAPEPLLEAVEREQSATKFCYTEFGQKADPNLRGNVAMVVIIGSGGVTDARVGDSRWTGSAGRAVNRCLDQKAKAAWNVAPGAVKPGRYVVQLSFSGKQ